MKKSLLIAAIILLHFYAQTTLALDPMDPLASTLRKGQFGIGADYSYSEMDFKAKGRSVLTTYNVANGDVIGVQSQKQRLSLKDIEVHKAYANVGYGITDNLEAFLRLGTSDTEWRGDGDMQFSIGLRTGMTLYERDALKLSALAQVSWAESNFDALPLTTIISGTQYPLLMSGEITMQEVQIALGPSYDLTKDISIYGGAFFHFVDGELDLKGGESVTGVPGVGYYLDSSYDVDQVSELGAYVGTRIGVKNNVSYSIEYQHTNSADAIAMRLIWRF